MKLDRIKNGIDYALTDLKLYRSQEAWGACYIGDTDSVNRLQNLHEKEFEKFEERIKFRK